MSGASVCRSSGWVGGGGLVDTVTFMCMPVVYVGVLVFGRAVCNRPTY